MLKDCQMSAEDLSEPSAQVSTQDNWKKTQVFKTEFH